jgi:hypothetical protein
MPFVGNSFEARDDSRFRVAVVGINAWIRDADWPGDDDEPVQPRYARWWANAGLGKRPPDTYTYFERAYAEASKLATVLVDRCAQYRGRAFDLDPRGKRDIYGTNAMKVYASEEFRRSDGIPDELLWGYAPTWQAELEAMAALEVFPDLIVMLGEQVWEAAWRALNPYAPNFSGYAHFELTDYQAAGVDGGPSYHYANRVRVRGAAREQDVLLVRLHHPSAHSAVPKRADWLLAQPDFRTLCGLQPP